MNVVTMLHLKGLLCPVTVALRLLEDRMREVGHTVELRSSTAIRFLPNRLLSNSTPTTFEITVTKLSSVRTNFIFVVIYRPGSIPVSDLFFTDSRNLMESLSP